MSIKQLEFQLAVLQRRIHVCALNIEQTFSEVLSEALRAKDPNAEHVREAIRTLRGSARYAQKFALAMDQRERDMKHIMGLGISVATRLYHHAEVVRGARIGRVVADDALWTRVFTEMTRLVYVHPSMYTASSMTLDRSLKIIEDILDALIFAEVPLNFEATPRADVRPLTPRSLEGRRTFAPQVRAAPSAVDDDQTAAESVMSQRRSGHISPCGSVVTAQTVGDLMHVRIPDKRGKK